MVKKYDSVIPDDLYEWLDFVEMKEEEFWNICDTFRSKKVWEKKNNIWIKDNIWEESEKNFK
jgi:hypothetical protein